MQFPTLISTSAGQARTTTSLMPAILAVCITLFGKYHRTGSTHLCLRQDSLDATTFDSRRDQRQAINRFNRYVLGQTYRLNAARFCPRGREYVQYVGHSLA